MIVTLSNLVRNSSFMRRSFVIRIWIRLCVCALTLCPYVLLAEVQSATKAEKWDRRYSGAHYLYGTEPVEFLKQNVARFNKGKALVLAAGEGRNAVYLAQQGFQVTAIDLSAKGLEKCQQLAKKKKVRVKTVVADVNSYDLGENQYDLVTNFYFYDSAIFPKVMTALKPGGYFVLQTFSLDQPMPNRFGPRNPAYLVKPNELLGYFLNYRIRHYEDTFVDLNEGMHQGRAAVIRLIVEKEGVL